MLIKFSQIFRFTLQYTGRVIMFEKEWAQVSGFLEIAIARHGDKLFVTHNLDPAIFSYGIPSLTLQPIIENSIKHGLQPREVGGSIAIEGTMTDTDIIITVTDDGVGFQGDPDIIWNIRHKVISDLAMCITACAVSTVPRTVLKLLRFLKKAPPLLSASLKFNRNPIRHRNERNRKAIL